MFSIKEVKVNDGFDCWGKYETKTVYDVYSEDTFLCRMQEDPTVLVAKLNEINQNAVKEFAEWYDNHEEKRGFPYTINTIDGPTKTYLSADGILNMFNIAMEKQKENKRDFMEEHGLDI